MPRNSIPYDVDCHILYRHTPDETAQLAAAVEPLLDHIRAVGAASDLGWIKRILGGQYFRYGNALRMRKVLLAAANHARAHLDDYFPMMRQDVIAQAEHLENAVNSYWRFLEESVAFKTPRQ
jgi:hypothetical protein